ncbi:FkbM family methyltransferase [Hymenobacter lutimineralis]|uniref:FkbM family methyltransferase n=1 Tax=Hymenobacter lutimineralis TaxID=2606448 RepID=A0A5D6V8E1_9BACT|nr:FkbM family methyltransferase [Hymenobacter lutimineralis]TYZ10924.1 FkbM family methyltransferase [Hymenobacter lutimineralis]
MTTTSSSATLLRRLDKIEQLAQAGRLRRLWHAPARYLWALGFRTFVYARTHRGKVCQTPTFFGVPMTVVLPAGTDIYLLGAKSHGSELRLARFLIRELQPGQHFVDVGAHFGYFTLLAAQLVGAAGSVRGFEAGSHTYAVLQDNVAGQANVQIFHRAVSDKAEPVSFYEFPVQYNEFNSMHVGQFEQETWFGSFKPACTTVEAVSLDEAVYAAGPAPHIIKIDVEGAEAQVIRGAEHLLRQQAPLVILEYLAPARHNASHREAAALLAELGYHPHRLDDAGRLQPCPDLEAFLLEQQLDSDNFVFKKTSA